MVTDFLPTVPLPCFLLLLETLGGFGLQKVAVNISLSGAVELPHALPCSYSYASA